MGMGLSICRTIVEEHGGRLWANENEPQGALFQFALPPTDGVDRDQIDALVINRDISRRGMAASGTNRTSSDVRSSVANGGKPDIAPTAQFGRD
jgi:hypothetical protein